MASFDSHRAHKECLCCERRHPFCNFAGQTLVDYDKIGVVINRAPGARLFCEGDPARHVFVVCVGRVKISTTSRGGNTMILKIGGPGDVLGLSAMLANAFHETTADVIEPCQVKVLRKPELMQFFGGHGIASMHAAHSLSTEYLTVFHDVRRLALPRSAPGRLARLLLDWGQAAADDKSELCFTMALTHEEIANMAGTSRETVTRCLSQFRQKRWIAIDGTSFTIVKPDQLESLAA